MPSHTSQAGIGSPLADLPVSDMTDGVRARLMEAIPEATDMGLCVLDPAGRYTYANSRYQALMGVKDVFRVGATPDELINALGPAHPERADALARIQGGVRGLIADPEARRVGVEFDAADGASVLARSVSTRDRHIVTVLEDLGALGQNSELFETALEAAGGGVWSLDFSTNLYTFSRSITARLSGAEREKIANAGLWALVERDDIPNVMAKWTRALQTDDTVDITYRVRTEADGLMWQRSAGRIERDADGRTVRVVAFVRDISQDMDRELRLVSAQKGEAAKTEFLARMSHEIRTPLNAVIGLCDMLREDHEFDPDVREVLDEIDTAATGLQHLLTQTLDHSKLVADKVELDPAETAVHDLLRDIQGLWGPQARAKSLAFSVASRDGTPAHIVVDRLRLMQCINNLISNAVKFTANGAVGVQFAAATDAGGTSHLVVRVSDTGIGMSADAVARLREPFEQAELSTTRRFGGTGLGMTITYQLVELMGGRIRVKSEPGRGTVIDLILPVDVPGVAPRPRNVRKAVAKTAPAETTATKTTPAKTTPAKTTSLETATPRKAVAPPPPVRKAHSDAADLDAADLDSAKLQALESRAAKPTRNASEPDALDPPKAPKSQAPRPKTIEPAVARTDSVDGGADRTEPPAADLGPSLAELVSAEPPLSDAEPPASKAASKTDHMAAPEATSGAAADSAPDIPEDFSALVEAELEKAASAMAAPATAAPAEVADEAAADFSADIDAEAAFRAALGDAQGPAVSIDEAAAERAAREAEALRAALYAAIPETAPRSAAQLTQTALKPASETAPKAASETSHKLAPVAESPTPKIHAPKASTPAVPAMPAPKGAARPAPPEAFAPEPVQDSAEDPAEGSSETRRAAFSGLRVLCVEDNAANRRLVERLLCDVVGHLAFAENGLEALQALDRDASFDVILMDVHMPVMDGIETTIAIRNSAKAYAKVVIIALTADADYQHRRVCRNLGMNDTISKPVRRREILNAFARNFDELGEIYGQDIALTG